MRNLHINGQRLWDSLHEIARIGPGIAGGNNRQALTDKDSEARYLFRDWCTQAGCKVSVDTMGNMFAIREGEDPSALPVCVGSHLDTQPTGGKYDGVLGVLAGLEIVRSLNDLAIKTRHPIVITNWTNEEGARFAPAMLGSGVFAGIHTEEWANNRKDGDGKRFVDELERIGWRGNEPVGKRKIHAFFELHIEQGPLLEASGDDIGIVTDGQGLRWIEITLLGKESHTGTTPMHLRHDATLAMARIVQKVEEIVLVHAPNAVGSVGRLEVFPNSRNVIAGKAVFTVDLRSPDLEILLLMQQHLLEEAHRIADEAGLEILTEDLGGFEPVHFDEKCVDALRKAARKLQYRHRDIISGAGHDACWINKVAPTAMVMCPCVGGLSHNEAEEITESWSKKAAEVLFHAVLETAEIIV